MPKDQWARDKAKERGRRALASGEYSRIDDKSVRFRPKRKKKRKKTESKKVRRAKSKEKIRMRANGTCPKCINSYVEKIDRVFKNGTMHIEQRCASCGAFIKWGE